MALLGRRSSGGRWVKIQKLPIGESVTGRFVMYEVDRPSDFGNEDVLTLEEEDGSGLIYIRANAAIKQIMRGLEVEQGRLLKVIHKGPGKSKGGKPFARVDIDDLDADLEFPVGKTEEVKAPFGAEVVDGEAELERRLAEARMRRRPA